MTSKERVMAALNYQRPDRIPRFDSYWDEFSEKCIGELSLPSEIDLPAHFGMDIKIAIADETPFPTKREMIREDGEVKIERDGWGRTIQTQKGAFFYRELEVAVEEKNDLDKIQFDSPDLDLRYGDFMGQVGWVEDGFCVFCKTGGPYLRTTFLRGESNFLLDIASDRPFAKALADRMADHIIQIGLNSLARGNLYDTGLWIFDDIAYNQGPMMSPDAFEQIFLPAYRRMVSAFKDAGAAKVILHSDGNIGPLLDMFIDAGIEGINPVEPRAGLHIPTLKAKYGDKLVYIGGMCNSQVLPEGAEAEIRKKTEEIVEAGRDGGVIIGAHSIGPDIPVENYLLYLKTVERKGVYR